MTSAIPTSGVSGSADLRDLVVQWRRHLHQHPELSFHEEETARFVHETLESFGGLEITRPTCCVPMPDVSMNRRIWLEKGSLPMRVTPVSWTVPR